MISTRVFLVFSFIIGGAAVLFVSKPPEMERLRFLPAADEQKNFGAFHPEIPDHEFNEIGFV